MGMSGNLPENFAFVARAGSGDVSAVMSLAAAAATTRRVCQNLSSWDVTALTILTVGHLNASQRYSCFQGCRLIRAAGVGPCQ